MKNKIAGAVAVSLFIVGLWSCEGESNIVPQSPDTTGITVSEESNIVSDSSSSQKLNPSDFKVLDFSKSMHTVPEPFKAFARNASSLSADNTRSSLLPISKEPNSGRMIRSFNGSNHSLTRNLTFGQRLPEHTTQWMVLDIKNPIDRRIDSNAAATNNTVEGSISFYLNAFLRRVRLNCRVVPATPSRDRSVLVSIFTSARLNKHNVFPQVIRANDGPMELLIASNDTGWLWIRLIQDGEEKYNASHRYTYSGSNTRNGGVVSISGFKKVRTPINIDPFGGDTRVSLNFSYQGLAGWFQEPRN